MRVALISDTHGYMGPEILEVVASADEVWHAGDIGDRSVTDALRNLVPLRAVYGNIDGGDLRVEYPEDAVFMVEGLSVVMTHIAGSPGKYNPRVRKLVEEQRPGLLVCGHSHILKVQRDPVWGHLHMNPGAAGHHGFHVIRTMLTFRIEEGKISDLAVVEFGRRGRL